LFVTLPLLQDDRANFSDMFACPPEKYPLGTALRIVEVRPMGTPGADGGLSQVVVQDPAGGGGSQGLHHTFTVLNPSLFHNLVIEPQVEHGSDRGEPAVVLRVHVPNGSLGLEACESALPSILADQQQVVSECNALHKLLFAISRTKDPDAVLQKAIRTFETALDAANASTDKVAFKSNELKLDIRAVKESTERDVAQHHATMGAMQEALRQYKVRLEATNLKYVKWDRENDAVAKSVAAKFEK
jgi:hypothetical protein